jgi:hypothetical protein
MSRLFVSDTPPHQRLRCRHGGFVRSSFDRNNRKDSYMRKSLITTVSTAALLLGGATFAAAQDRTAPETQDPAVNKPAAGAIKRDDSMQK